MKIEKREKIISVLLEKGGRLHRLPALELLGCVSNTGETRGSPQLSWG